MKSTTKRLTTTASALTLGLLLSGPFAMAADAPVAPPSTAAAPAATEFQWTPEARQQYWDQMQQKAKALWTKWGLTPAERRQYWEQMQQKASELWTTWGLTPEQRQQYAAQMQGWWNDLGTTINPPAETLPTVPATAAVDLAAPAAAQLRRPHYPWSTWRMTPEQRHQYWANMQHG